MTKQDFLEKLRGALNGRMTSGMIAENIRYYEDYINTEVRKGRSEREVLAALGDPRLIARTIIEAGGGKEAQKAENNRTQGRRRGPGGRGGTNLLSRVPALIWLILAILIVILILSAVFSVISAILPVVLPILLVLLLVKIFRDWVH